MDSQFYHDLGFSKYNRIANMALRHQILSNFDASRFDLGKLNSIFDAFMNAIHKDQLYYNQQDIEKMIVGLKYQTPVQFVHDKLVWEGKMTKHRWTNVQDEKTWYTLSIKLPNENHLYNSHHVHRPQSSEPRNSLGSSSSDSTNSAELAIPHISTSSLNQKHYRDFESLIIFALNMFEGYETSTQIFYNVRSGRTDFKVKCDALRMWLEITYKNLKPVEDQTDGWLTREELLQLLNDSSGGNE